MLVVVLIPVLVFLAFSWRLGALGGVRVQHRHAVAVARRWGLPADSVDQAFVRRITRRQRFVQTGVLLGLAVVTFTSNSWYLPLYAGLALGAVADQLAAPPLPPDTPRVAHATEPRLTDYVPAWILGAALLAAVCAPVLAVLWAVRPHVPFPHSLSATGTAALAVGSVGGLGVSLALARFVVRRPQAAGSTAELALADGLRAQAVRDALHVTAVVSLVCTAVLGLKIEEIDGTMRHVGGYATTVMIVGVLLVICVHELTGGPRHWRGRLERVPA